MKKDVYLEVTNTIVRQLENGFTDKGWTRPWRSLRGSYPMSVDNREYRGLNFWILMAAAMEKGYDSHLWGTYKAWMRKGAKVRKGEKGTMVILWKPVTYKDTNDNGDEVVKNSFYLRAWYVFNVSQVDDYVAPDQETMNDDEANKHMEAEKCLEEYLNREIIPLEHKGDRAFYAPEADRIQMPPVKAFHTKEDYLAVLAHECGHSTGHKSRLDRKLDTARFGNEAYAFEELVAELCAAMFCATQGVKQADNLDENHAKYVKSWIKVLKDDKKAIFTAASKAQKACDMIQNIQVKKQEEEKKEAA